MSSDRWIEYGKRLAGTVQGKYRHASLILDKRGRLIASGVNSYVKTHPRQNKLSEKFGNKRKDFLHAEIAALSKCRVKPYKIINIRLRRDGSTGMAAPCPLCNHAIQIAGIKVVEYTV